MSSDIPMTPLCRGCGVAEDLYGISSLCLGCGFTGLIMGLYISNDDTWSTSKTSVSAVMDTSLPSSGPSTVPITEDEVRAVLLSWTNVTPLHLVSMFKPRLRSGEDRDAFTALLKKIARIRKTNEINYVVLREDTCCTSRYNIAAKDTPSLFPRPLTAPSTGPITEDEIRAVLMTRNDVTTLDLVAMFKPRLRSSESKDAFTAKMKKICRINKMNGMNYVCLKETTK